MTGESKPLIKTEPVAEITTSVNIKLEPKSTEPQNQKQKAIEEPKQIKMESTQYNKRNYPKNNGTATQTKGYKNYNNNWRRQNNYSNSYYNYYHNSLYNSYYNPYSVDYRHTNAYNSVNAITYTNNYQSTHVNSDYNSSGSNPNNLKVANIVSNTHEPASAASNGYISSTNGRGLNYIQNYYNKTPYNKGRPNNRNATSTTTNAVTNASNNTGTVTNKPSHSSWVKTATPITNVVQPYNASNNQKAICASNTTDNHKKSNKQNKYKKWNKCDDKKQNREKNADVNKTHVSPKSYKRKWSDVNNPSSKADQDIKSESEDSVICVFDGLHEKQTIVISDTEDNYTIVYSCNSPKRRKLDSEISNEDSNSKSSREPNKNIDKTKQASTIIEKMSDETATLSKSTTVIKKVSTNTNNVKECSTTSNDELVKTAQTIPNNFINNIPPINNVAVVNEDAPNAVPTVGDNVSTNNNEVLTSNIVENIAAGVSSETDNVNILNVNISVETVTHNKVLNFETTEREEDLINELLVNENIEYCLKVSNLPIDWNLEQIENYLDVEIGIVKIQILHDDEGKFRGAARLQFDDREKCYQALKKLNEMELKGQKLHARRIDNALGSSGIERISSTVTAKVGIEDAIAPFTLDFWKPDPKGLYGLKPEFLESLGVTAPITKWIRVTNFNCDKSELKDVMEVAGRVRVCYVVSEAGDKYAVIMYSHPLEAVQAISMLHNRNYKGSQLQVSIKPSMDAKPVRLPPGLTDIGPGLGPGGKPLVFDHNIVNTGQLPSGNLKLEVDNFTQ